MPCLARHLGDVSSQYGARDETCPVSTGKGVTSAMPCALNLVSAQCGAMRSCGCTVDLRRARVIRTRRVRLVREEGRGVSSQYWGEGGGPQVALGERAAHRGALACTRRVRLVRGEGRGVST